MTTIMMRRRRMDKDRVIHELISKVAELQEKIVILEERESAFIEKLLGVVEDIESGGL